MNSHAIHFILIISLISNIKSDFFDVDKNFSDLLDDGEYGDEFEGDMILTPEQKEFLTPIKRTGIIDPIKQWPKNFDGLVYVPYVIDAASNYSSIDTNKILRSMDFIANYTCIRFVPREHHANYIEIYSGSGCKSSVGRVGGKQQISLKIGNCFLYGKIMHEMMHALGFGHEQSHIDRDKYVEIKWSNIKEGRSKNFEIINPLKFQNYGTDYDYNSAMHYSSKAFSKNDKDTIVAKNKKFQSRIGQRKKLSDGDIQRTKNMYKCRNQRPYKDELRKFNDDE